MNMKTVYLNNFMSSVVTELERNGQYSTAHVCGSVLRSVMTFDGDGLLLSGITPLWLKAYEHYLLHKGEKGLEWNTISTYMCMLRAIYNRAVVRKLVPFVPHLFREVFTGRKADHRRVLERDDMRQLLAEKDLEQVLPDIPEWLKRLLLEHDYEAEQRLYDSGRPRNVWFVSCQKLLEKDAQMERMDQQTQTRIRELEELGAHGLAVHVGTDQQAAGRKPIDDLRVMAEHCRSAKISVAGGIKPETVPEYAALKPEVLIVGSGITHAADPKEAARQIKESMEKSVEKSMGGGR